MGDCPYHVLREGVAKVPKINNFILYVFAGVLKMHHVHKMLKKAGPTTVNMTQSGWLRM